MGGAQGQPPTKILIESHTVNKNHYMTKTAERANTVMCATRINQRKCIIALLIHFFLSIGPGKPSTAFFNFQVIYLRNILLTNLAFIIIFTYLNSLLLLNSTQLL